MRAASSNGTGIYISFAHASATVVPAGAMKANIMFQQTGNSAPLSTDKAHRFKWQLQGWLMTALLVAARMPILGRHVCTPVVSFCVRAPPHFALDSLCKAMRTTA
jgi:hypothetical protein